MVPMTRRVLQVPLVIVGLHTPWSRKPVNIPGIDSLWLMVPMSLTSLPGTVRIGAGVVGPEGFHLSRLGKEHIYSCRYRPWQTSQGDLFMTYASLRRGSGGYCWLTGRYCPPPAKPSICH